MPRPRVFRDQIHGQIRFKRVDLSNDVPTEAERKTGWLIPNLINCSEFQRLRHIRQNGLTNLVFSGMEHSRFSHSIGVSYLAGQMHDRVITNAGLEAETDRKLALLAAGLLHDIGHGPFSHVLEEVLREVGIAFDHEHFSSRIIQEDTEINACLKAIDITFPDAILPFIDKKKRLANHWIYRIVSSQLDADRLDYLLRDALQAGLQGHGFDMPRLLDMLTTFDEKHIGVDRHAKEAVEAYLVMLEHMYAAIYFHRGIRCATVLLKSVLRRAVDIYREGDTSVFPIVPANRLAHPFKSLIDEGNNVAIKQYNRLGDFQIWTLIEEWQQNEDRILSDLAQRLMKRQRFRAVDITSTDINNLIQTVDSIKSQVRTALPFLNDQTINYYVVIDEPQRTGYKRYDWLKEITDDSIWMTGGDEPPCPIEDEPNSGIVAGLKRTRYFPRIIFPHEIHSVVNISKSH